MHDIPLRQSNYNNSANKLIAPALTKLRIVNIIHRQTGKCKVRRTDILPVCNGDIAQLGERLNGIQEVSSSILLISTK